MRTFVVSDIHGCFKTFRYLIEEKLALTKEDTLYLLGDYIDRGPDSKGVIDYIMELQKTFGNVYPLRGNHEQILLNAYDELPFFEKTFIKASGGATMKSFGLSKLKDLPKRYLDFFHALPYYKELDKFILVHAGLNFTSGSVFDDHEAMLWLRDYRVDPHKIKNKIIVHGHTPVALKTIRASIDNASQTHRIFLDNGCVYKNAHEELGMLCCLHLETRELVSCENLDW